MVARGQNFCLLQWTAPALRFERLQDNGQEVHIPVLGDLPLDLDHGSLALPTTGIAIEIPTGAKVTLLIEDSSTVAVANGFLLPYALMVREQGPEGVDRISYRFVPSGPPAQEPIVQRSFVTLDGTATVAGHQLLRVAIHPLRYDPTRRSARLLTRARIRVEWEGLLARHVSVSPADDVKRVFQAMCERTLRPESRARSAGVRGDYGWYDPTRPYCKLLVVDQGLYGVRGYDLYAVGVGAEGIASASLRMYHLGNEVPIAVFDGDDGSFDAQDLLIFPAQRRRGDSTYYAAASDTNVYWLTWGGAPGLRLSSTPSPPAGRPMLRWFVDTCHVEYDRHYYSGDSDAEVHNTFATPGEGWIWRFFNPGDSLRVDVPLTGFAPEGDSLRLMVRLRGTTLDPVSPDHHARVWLNGRLAADVWFDNRQDSTVRVSLPASVGRKANEVAIASVGRTGATIDQFYLDWIELIYPRRPAAVDGQFVGLLPAAGDVAIQGFAGDSIVAVDVTNGRLLTQVGLSHAWWARFSLLSAGFHDGNRAEFWQDEQLVWIGGRGHNLVVVDHQTGRILDKKHFDTYASAADADSMAAYVERLPSGTIVLVAIADEGTVGMTERAHSALQSLGSALTRQVGVRGSWALVGRKGATPGSVPEALAPAYSGPARLSEVIDFPSGGPSVTASFGSTWSGDAQVMAADRGALRRPARLVPDHPSQLRAPTNGADYLIVTHPSFAVAAEALASFRRQHNGFAVSTAFVEDIYDEFTYGLADPVAIRLFVSHATGTWQKRPTFLLLLGDASWDPKRLLPETEKTDFVPSFGNPVSDAWFVATDGPDDLLPDLFVGRIPAETPEQAMDVVRKIIAYDSDRSPAPWKKHVLLINGGFDAWEQRQFGEQSRFLVDSVIARPPAACLPTIISKTTTGYFQGEHREDILAALNDGVMWTNFVGHAGTGTWDLMLNSSDLLDLGNAGRYTFVTSMTCHTARFANPYQNCFGEEFLRMPRSGAVAFWGTTGWGYLFHDHVLVTNLFRAALLDTVHLLGQATTLAKLRLWENLGGSQFSRDVILQYTLLGDPATDLALPSLPDLVVTPSDLLLAPSEPSEDDSLVQVHVRVHNFGLATAESVEVELWGRSPGTGAFQIENTRRLPPMGWQDSALFVWSPRGLSGAFELEAVVDPANRVQETVETDNRAAVRVALRAAQVALLKPFPYAVVTKTPTLEVLTPPNPVSPLLYVEFEVDTTATFGSGALQRSPVVVPGVLSTIWRPSLSVDGRYFWRARAVYQNGPGPWREACFTLDAQRGGLCWEQRFPLPSSDTPMEDTEPTPAGMQLGRTLLPLRVESAGFHDGQYARVLVGGTPALAQGRGHNVAVVHPGTGQVLAAQAFDTYESSSEADRMAEFISQVPEGMIVLAAIADEGSQSMTELAYAALETIGSALCRQVGARDSWALIGRKGATPGSVPERWLAAGHGVVVLQDTLVFHKARGWVTSPLIGPAVRWQSVEWELEQPHLSTTSTVSVEAYERATGAWLPVAVAPGAQGGCDLSLDHTRFSQVRLRAELSTSDGRWSPALRWWRVHFAPAPELAALPLRVAPSGRVVAGDPVQLELEARNIGYAPAEKVVVWWTQSYGGAERIFACDTLSRALAPDSTAIIRRLWPTAGLGGTYLLKASIDPSDQIIEPVEFNNIQTTVVEVAKDSVPPRIALLFDGRPIAAGDFVRSRPYVVVQLFDNSGGALSDTLGLDVSLDGTRLAFSAGEPLLRLLPPGTHDDSSLKGSVVLEPALAPGRHTMEVVFTDPNGNASRSRAEFQVAERFELREVVNYPNPFRTGTDFCYVLTAPAEKVEIRIYTLAGRLIRTLAPAPNEAGFNRLHWDGRDEDGDDIANGVYLYKLSAVQEGRQVAVIGKAVVAR
ncbi:MAG: C25 family cysteine peptidase [candidate division KSB1 bacterium]|nr:C25 family cysteine peptidase [candidate division KSB1 bacterium]